MKIAIIGSGSSAFAAAIYAAEQGAQVIMIERSTIGGTCVNVGCVPSKIFIRSAHVAHTQKNHPFFGIPRVTTIIDRKSLLKQQQERVNALRIAKYEDVLKANPNITFIKGTAKFQNANTLLVTNASETQLVKVDKILIATGRSPFIPNIPGLKNIPYWTSTSALESESLPKHLIVLGGSVVALELAQAFLRLGTKVTLIARSTLLSKYDPDIGRELLKIFKHEGMNVITNTVPDKIDYADAHFKVTTKEGVIMSDKLLVATGRQPNTPDLALDKAGVKLDAKGAVIVDRYLQTSAKTIYASGDCTNQPQFVYVAAAAGTHAAANMLGKKVTLDLSIVPEVVFTEPQVAVVGLTEAQAKAKGLLVDSRLLSLENVPRSLANFDTQGFIKLVAEKPSGRILGAQILAEGAGDVIQTIAIAMRAKMTINQLASQLFPYLTMAEGLKLCAQTFTTDVKKLSCCASGLFFEGTKDPQSDSTDALDSSTKSTAELLQDAGSFGQPPLSKSLSDSEDDNVDDAQVHNCCQ